jgi:g-D-glutamyl-meso-diaminopimelate peptidase
MLAVFLPAAGYAQEPDILTEPEEIQSSSEQESDMRSGLQSAWETCVEQVSRFYQAWTQAFSPSATPTPEPTQTPTPTPTPEPTIDPATIPQYVDVSDAVYTYAEMAEDIAQLKQSYGNRLTVNTVGTSADGRAIYLLVLGDSNAAHAVYIHATIHGREWMNSMLVMKELEETLRNWDTPTADGTTYGEWLQQCAIYLVPMVNPDGVTIAQSGIGAIQSATLRAKLQTMSGASNTARWKANANGVDLNRNFSVGWNARKESSKPSSSGYSGASAMSEPETQAVAAAVATRKFDAAVSYHSMEGVIYWDIGQTGTLRTSCKELATLLKNTTGYGFGVQSPVGGLDYNWLIDQCNIPTALIETGTTSCPLPYTQWKTMWSKNKDVFITLAQHYVA